MFVIDNISTVKLNLLNVYNALISFQSLLFGLNVLEVLFNVICISVYA